MVLVTAACPTEKVFVMQSRGKIVPNQPTLHGAAVITRPHQAGIGVEYRRVGQQPCQGDWYGWAVIKSGAPADDLDSGHLHAGAVDDEGVKAWIVIRGDFHVRSPC